MTDTRPVLLRKRVPGWRMRQIDHERHVTPAKQGVSYESFRFHKRRRKAA